MQADFSLLASFEAMLFQPLKRRSRTMPMNSIADNYSIHRSILRVTYTVVGLSSLVLATVSTTQAASVTWVCSTENKPWEIIPTPSLTVASPDKPALVRAVAAKTFQVIDGFGCCFNETGWIALNEVAEQERRRALNALFGDDGCAFNLARIPIGASDFATSAYSLDDTPGDLELKDFSIARDEKNLIPFIKAAMTIRPTLRCWGSPWSPPAWMKTNNHYSKGSLKWEPPILRSYAEYLARWVEAYRAAGVNVYAICPQNEPNILNVYPTCLWTGPQLRDFIADYLGPTLKERKTNVELWLGTLNDGNANDRAATVLDNAKANAFVSGVTFQYDAKGQIADVSQMYPDKKLMQSETECNNGENSWTDAMRLYGLMKHYLERNAGSYFAWNMVLNETGMSNWNWKQNALITVDRKAGAIRLNGEYYVMRHFSQFIKPGAKRILSTGPWSDKIAFVNPDGSTVMVIGNSSKNALPVILSVAGRKEGDTLNVVLPAKSVNTFVIEPK